jgi:hypothetical protein
MSMIRSHRRRLEKLEVVNKIDKRIPIYVDDEKDLQTRIGELIAVGALQEGDRQRCVFWLRYRHYSKWQVNDEAALRLKAQAAIKTPCATWLPAESHAEASASACLGEVDAGSPIRTSANQINQVEQAGKDDGTTAAC